MISKDKDTDAQCKAEAKGLITKLKSAKHMLNMFLMRDLAYILEINSKNLKKMMSQRKKRSTVSGGLK